MEQLFTDIASWLNCAKGLADLAKGLSDLALIRGKYSISEKEGRLRLETLTKRWDMSRARLKLWLSGESARHLSTRGNSTGAEGEPIGGASKYAAIADISPQRYMPNGEWLSAERNGAAEWEAPATLGAISPVVAAEVGPLVRMGLGNGMGGDSKPKPLSKDTPGAAAARERRRKEEELERRGAAEGSRQRLSLFSR